MAAFPTVENNTEVRRLVLTKRSYSLFSRSLHADLRSTSSAGAATFAESRPNERILGSAVQSSPYAHPHVRDRVVSLSLETRGVQPSRTMWLKGQTEVTVFASLMLEL